MTNHNNDNTDKNKLVYFGIKIPKTLKNSIEELVEVDTHTTESEFGRSALREYVEKIREIQIKKRQFSKQIKDEGDGE